MGSKHVWKLEQTKLCKAPTLGTQTKAPCWEPGCSTATKATCLNRQESTNRYIWHRTQTICTIKRAQKQKPQNMLHLCCCCMIAHCCCVDCFSIIISIHPSGSLNSGTRQLQPLLLGTRQRGKGKGQATKPQGQPCKHQSQKHHYHIHHHRATQPRVTTFTPNSHLTGNTILTT